MDAAVRRAAVAVALILLATGCTVTTNGTVAAAPTLGHAPRPVSTAALAGLLLSTREAGSVMGAPLSLTSSSQGLFENEPLDDGCLVWADAQRRTYEGAAGPRSG